ncbi:unnamed protein product [Calypogeia fissa]
MLIGGAFVSCMDWAACGEPFSAAIMEFDGSESIEDWLVHARLPHRFSIVVFLTPDEEEDKEPIPPFRVTLPKASVTGTKKAGARKRKGVEEQSNDTLESKIEKPKILVEAYVPPDPGPYPQDQPKKNTVRFMPVQVELTIRANAGRHSPSAGQPGVLTRSKAILYSDARAEFEADEIARLAGGADNVASITGFFQGASSVLAKL